ncbi:hypothetical protein GQ53DRAFT_259960 [Thozetella sp. PMI_491]|nr:hypothetical protein GQ53DRAFT_259960 [Thozetella sp. PMI_491]
MRLRPCILGPASNQWCCRVSDGTVRWHQNNAPRARHSSSDDRPCSSSPWPSCHWRRAARRISRVNAVSVAMRMATGGWTCIPSTTGEAPETGAWTQGQSGISQAGPGNGCTSHERGEKGNWRPRHSIFSVSPARSFLLSNLFSFYRHAYRRCRRRPSVSKVKCPPGCCCACGIFSDCSFLDGSACIIRYTGAGNQNASKISKGARVATDHSPAGGPPLERATPAARQIALENR